MIVEGGYGTKKGATKNPWAQVVKKMGGVKKAVENKAQYQAHKDKDKKTKTAKPKKVKKNKNC